ncbi:5447_t:CDS:2 [Diversispora eburnea]|uniref:5447_t:CDS:1 n=1 Tax=Diversispora eburnea TaxID=1213867 RepID=A0A9N9A622_9GLOM|nr:5447_t:CDS:2 [Diversispora eburnea]
MTRINSISNIRCRHGSSSKVSCQFFPRLTSNELINSCRMFDNSILIKSTMPFLYPSLFHHNSIRHLHESNYNLSFSNCFLSSRKLSTKNDNNCNNRIITNDTYNRNFLPKNIKKFSEIQMNSLYKERSELIRRLQKIRKQGRLFEKNRKIGRDISKQQEHKTQKITEQLKIINQIITSQQKYAHISPKYANQKEIVDLTVRLKDTRTPKEIEEKTLQWKRNVDSVPLRLIRTYLSSGYSKKDFRKVYEIFEELLYNSGDFKNASLNDLQRLAAYFAKIHTPYAISVLKAALNNGFELTYNDYHILLISFRKIKDQISVVRIFQEMKEKKFLLQAEDYNEVLRCLMSKGSKNIDLAKIYLAEAKSKYFRLNCDTYVTLIDGFIENKDVLGAETILMPLWKRYLLEEIYNIFIQTFIYYKDLDKAKKFYRKLLNINSSPDFEIVQIIIESCLNNNEVMAANNLLKHTNTSNIAYLYAQVLEYCTKYKKFKYLWITYVQSLNKQIQLPESIYKKLIITYCQEGYSPDVLILYKEAKSLGYFCENLFIHNLVAQVLVFNEQIEQTHQILLDIQKLKLKPNMDTYRIIIQLASIQNDSKIAEEVFKEIQKKKLGVDHLTFKYLIRCFCTIGEFERTKRTINLMQKNYMKPNINDYNILIKAYGNGSKLNQNNQDNTKSFTKFSKDYITEKVLEIFNIIHNSNIIPNDETYYILIEIFTNIGNYEMATKIYNSMSKVSIRPNLEIFHIILRNVIKTQGLNNGVEIFWDQVVKSIYNGMWERGMKMKEVKKYEEIIKLLVKKKEFEKVEEIIEQMNIIRIENDEINRGYLIILDEYMKLKKFEKIEMIWKKLKEEKEIKGIRKISKDVYNYILRLFVEMNNKYEVKRLCEEMIKDGIKIDSVNFEILS